MSWSIGTNFGHSISAAVLKPDVDTTAPADVTDLATGTVTNSSIALTWTAPGDDGATGTATTYDIRYSTSAINAGNWASATQASGEPTPSVAGTSESFTVTGLSPSTTYYFAIKTSDEASNESGVSNSPSAATLVTHTITQTGYSWSDDVSTFSSKGNDTQLSSATGTTYVLGIQVTLSSTIASGTWNLQVREDGAGSWLNVFDLGGGSSPVWQTYATHTFSKVNGDEVATGEFGNTNTPSGFTAVSGEFSDDNNGLGDGYTGTNIYTELQYAIRAEAAAAGHTYEFRVDYNGTPLDAYDTYAQANLGQTLSGNVFEDVDYGGGAGRTKAASSGVARSGARVELFNSAGNFVTFTTTDGSGNYSFTGLAAGNYTVRVVNSTVTSSRSGYTTSALAVQTFRTTATSGAAVAVTDRVGGETPSLADAGNGSTTLAALTTGSTTAQSITSVTLGASDITGLDFGFNFDTIVNVNNTGQGSLRQFITNANTLGGDGSLAQSGLVSGKENAVFMISNGTAAAGLRSANNYFSGGVATINAASGFTISTPVILNVQKQPGFGSTPIVRLDYPSGSGTVDGITIASGGAGSTIRGLMVTRFTRDGVVIQAIANGVTVAGNWIGTNGTGVTTMKNTRHGMNIFGATATIGGTGTHDRNVIANNGNDGINVSGGSASSNIIIGNYIGLEPDGSTGAGNGDVGIALLAGGGSNRIGGLTTAERNVISMNLEGIEITCTNNIIQGNYIGTDAGGTQNRGQHGSDSIEIVSSSTGNTIGGTADGAGNLIAFTKNGYDGVSVESGSGNAVLGNDIHSNTGIGIDLGNNGATANDGNKTGGQPNLLMDHPVFTSASLSGTTLTVTGYVGSAPSQATFANARVEVFESDDDASGNGEGKTYLDFLTADANGNFSGTVDVSGKGLVVGEKITGTATDGSNNTSEFGANYTVTAPSATTQTGYAWSDDTSTFTSKGNDVPLISATGTTYVLGIQVSMTTTVASGTWNLQVREDGAGSWLNVYDLAGGTSPVWQTTSTHTFSKVNGDEVLVSEFGNTNTPSGFTAVSGEFSDDNNGLSDGYTGTNIYTELQYTIRAESAAAGHSYEFRVDYGGSPLDAYDTYALTVTGQTLSGTVFEDVNYGGGAGRTRAASSGVVRSGARVELFNAAGNFVTFTTTDGSGDYSFTGLAAGDYTVRVVNSTVTSSRTGYTSSALAVQTYRTTATSGAAVAVTDRVGGETPSLTDAGNGSTTLAALTTGSTTAQSITAVTAAGADISGLDFGFNFDTVVNANNSGQGSLRQFLTNANTLGGDGSLAQAGRTAGIDNAIWMISNGTAAAGLRSANNYFSGGVATIDAASGFTISTPLILDAQTQPGWSSAPIIELNGVGAGGSTNGILISASGVKVRGLIINRFTAVGIKINGTGALIAGNWIGLDANGTSDQGNTLDGVTISANSVTIGGTGSADRNVVSGNNDEGIDIDPGITGAVIKGNYIGTNWNGTAAVGNGVGGSSQGGILAEGIGTQIGGSLLNEGNLISGNTNDGIYLTGTTNVIEGNKIGTNAAGTGPIANSGPGIVILATNGGTNNRVGGGTSGQGNTIAFNTGDGIELAAASVTGNALSGNATFSNTGLGIDLNADGVTANDGAKPAGQPNLLMDHPVFTSASLSGTTLTVAGYVGSAPSQAIFAGARVEVFESDDDATGNGEGQTYLDFLTADASGNFSGTLDVTGKGLAAGEKITGTATDGSNNTSEFGANYTVAAPAPVITVTKSSAMISDPVNNTTNPKRIPGAIIEYSITAENSGDGPADADSTVVTDVIDAPKLAYDVTTGVTFVDGTTSSGLALGTVSFSSTAAPGPYVHDYTPVPDGDGFDGNVTSIKAETTGAFTFGGSPAPSFTVKYRTRVE